MSNAMKMLVLATSVVTVCLVVSVVLLVYREGAGNAPSETFIEALAETDSLEQFDGRETTGSQVLWLAEDSGLNYVVRTNINPAGFSTLDNAQDKKSSQYVNPSASFLVTVDGGTIYFDQR